MALFVFRVSTSFCKNVRFLAISFSKIEIACRSVSLTFTNSASYLLKFLCASASVEHVRRDLELMYVVQHYPNLLDLRRAKLILLCWSP